MSKDDILNNVSSVIEKFTNDFFVNNSSILSSDEIAKNLNLTRSSVSRYLNSLFNEKKLVKIHTRPVIFLDVTTLEKKANIKVNKFDFISVKEMYDYFNLSKMNYDFKDLIGYKGTLFEIINSLKSEINYPGSRILTIHFHGSKGTGKKKLASSLLRYCRENKIKDIDKNLYSYKCSNNLQNAKEILFGTKNSEGVLSKWRNGIIYLERAELLSHENQDLLANYLSLAEERKMNIGCIIFSTEEEGIIEKLESKMIASYNIPDLKDRSKIERNSLVCKFLRDEEEKFKKEIMISSFAFQTFSSIKFSNNIDGLRSAIIKVLANANTSDDDKIIIKTYNLVDFVSDYNSFFTSEGENVILTLDTIEEQFKHDDLLHKYNQFLHLYEKSIDTEIDRNSFFLEALSLLNSISDYLILNMVVDNDKINGLNKIISNICDLVKNRYDINIYNDTVLMLSKIIYKLAYLDSNIQEWSKKNSSKLQEIKNIYIDNYQEAAIIAQLIENLVDQFIEIKLDTMTFISLITIIANENQEINKDCCSLIIAHGYATASSIANTTNKILGKHVFDAIDMPLDISTTEIASKVDEYINDCAFIRNLILLVDMGSLEEISSMIKNSDNIKIGLINNVSTRMALLIGEGVINNEDIEEIMNKACQFSLANYKIIGHKAQEKAIIFTSEAGESISNRMMQLFKMSLPKKIEAKIVSHDYFELIKNGNDNLIFKNYNVLLIVGVNRKISNCQFIAFEELLTTESISTFDDILKSLLFNDEEIKKFNDNMLKNFSLENVMNTITILNANTLIDLIEDALKKLQKSLSIKLNSKVKYGLFIHLSSLIERLVIKSSGNVYSNIGEFEIEHQDFINSVKSSFEKLKNYYNVEIPLSEIAYLYDYIMNWI